MQLMTPSHKAIAMNMDPVLYDLGVRGETLSDDEKQFLDEEGYLPLPDMITPAQVTSFRDRVEEIIRAEGEDAGEEVGQEAGSIRLSDLINKDPMFDLCYTHPRLLAAIRHVLTSDFKVHSLNCRFPLPGQGFQALHMDWAPSNRQEQQRFQTGEYFVANSLWLLDDLSEENGATRLVPGSHRFKKTPAEMKQDPEKPHPDEMVVTARAGTVVVFNAHTWHGGTLNRSDKPRRVMHMAFVRRELSQQTDQRTYLRAETAARLTEEMRVLLDVQ